MVANAAKMEKHFRNTFIKDVLTVSPSYTLHVSGIRWTQALLYHSIMVKAAIAPVFAQEKLALPAFISRAALVG